LTPPAFPKSTEPKQSGVGIELLHLIAAQKLTARSSLNRKLHQLHPFFQETAEKACCLPGRLS